MKGLSRTNSAVTRHRLTATSAVSMEDSECQGKSGLCVQQSSRLARETAAAWRRGLRYRAHLAGNWFTMAPSSGLAAISM